MAREARLVLRLQRPHEPPALHGDVVVRGHEEDAVEPVRLADDDEPAHEVAQQAQAGVLLAGQPRPPRGEGLARVLQEQPLDRDHLHAGDRAAAAVRPQLDEELSGRVLREDAEGVAGRLARVELDPQRAEAAGAELGQDARALEEQLDPVAREVAEEARGARGPGHEPRRGPPRSARRAARRRRSPRSAGRGPGGGSAAGRAASSSTGSIARPEASQSR